MTVLILLCWYVIPTHIARLLLSLLAIISLNIAAMRHLLSLLYRLATLGSAFTLRTEDTRAWVVVSLAWCLSRSWRNLEDVLGFACHFLLEKVAQVALVLDCARHVLGAVEGEWLFRDIFD